jgi:hypothetical protein
MEILEWSVFAIVLAFVVGVFAMRGEITSAAQENPNAPIQSLDE